MIIVKFLSFIVANEQCLFNLDLETLIHTYNIALVTQVCSDRQERLKQVIVLSTRPALNRTLHIQR